MDTTSTLANWRVAQVLAGAEWSQKVGARGPEDMFWGLSAFGLAYKGDCAGQASLQTKHAIVPLGGLVPLASRTENDTLALTSWDDTAYTITRAPYYKAYGHTQEAGSTDALGILNNIPLLVEEAIAARNSTLFRGASALASSVTDTIGVSATALTLADLVLAEDTMRAKSVQGTYIGLLTPKMWASVRADLLVQSGTAWVPPTVAQYQIANRPEKYQGQVGGVHVFISEFLPDDATDASGMIFGNDALAWGDCTIEAGPAAVGLNIGPMRLGFAREETHGRDRTFFHDLLGFAIAQQGGCVRLRAAV